MGLKNELFKEGWIPLSMFNPSYDVLNGDDRHLENIELLDYAGHPFAELTCVVDLDANVRGDARPPHGSFVSLGKPDKIVGFELAVAYRVIK